ncbi:hypothetical protein CR513_27186, partial [Mucuna pruriens]
MLDPIRFGHSSLLLDRVDQPTPSTQEKCVSPQPQTTKLKPLPEHLKYAYLGDNQQFLMTIANNLNREEEEKLLELYADSHNTHGSTQDYLHMPVWNVCIYKDAVRTL